LFKASDKNVTLADRPTPSGVSHLLKGIKLRVLQHPDVLSNKGWEMRAGLRSSPFLATKIMRRVSASSKSLLPHTAGNEE
jgi:hypothetical protein